MALTADGRIGEFGSRESFTYQVVNGSQVFASGLTAVRSTDHATAASRGRASAWSGGVEEIPVGYVESGVTGDTALTPIPRVILQMGGKILRNVTVTGVSARSDLMRKVYYSDENTLTLTRPTRGLPIGFVTDHVTGTTAHVYIFSVSEMYIIALSGSGQSRELLGVVRAGLTTGNALTGIEAPYHGRILSVYGIVATTATDADVDLDFNLEIGGVNVTGGVIEWLAADVNGAKKAGTPITGTNIFHEGDLIDMEVVANTAATANDPGAMNIYAEVELLPGV